MAKLIARIARKSKSTSILLVPAAELNGGFGEDIMVVSFLTNFSKGNPVTILTTTGNEKSELRKIKEKLSFVNGFSNNKVNFIKMLFIIRKHNLLYVIGADIMDGTYQVNTSINRLRLLELAKILGVTAQISGFSVSSSILPEVKNKFKEISSAIPLKLRDIESFERLNKFIPREELILTNDMAFICPDIPSMYMDSTYNEYIRWIEKIRDNGKMIIAVCPNSIQARKIGLEIYIDSFKNLLKQFMEKDDFSFVFLYHDLRPLCDIDTDSTISKRLYEYFKEENINCFYTDKIYNGVQLKGFVAQTDFTITGRMHLGISGLTYKKPMFGIAYANKFEGMVKLFKIDPKICLIDYDNMRESRDQINLFLINLKDSKVKVAENIQNVQLNTFKNFI